MVFFLETIVKFRTQRQNWCAFSEIEVDLGFVHTHAYVYTHPQILRLLGRHLLQLTWHYDAQFRLCTFPWKRLIKPQFNWK